MFLLLVISLKAQTAPEFEHFKIDKEAPRISFFEAIEHIEIIRLEETDNSLLPTITRYFETPLGIAISNGKYGTDKPQYIALFDRNGNYKNVIHNQGPGPDEYKNITDAWFHNGRIELYSGFSRSIQRYTTEGEYLETIPLKENIWGKSMIPYQGGYLLHIRSSAPLDSAYFYYELAFMDKDLNVIKWDAPRSEVNQFPPNYGWNLSHLGQKLFYRKQLRDSVFQIIDQQVYPRFKFDFAEEWVWNDPKTIGSKNHESMNYAIKVMLNTGKAFEVLSTISEQYIFLTYIHYEDRIGKFSKGYINRKSGEFFRFDLRKKDKSNFDLEFLKWDVDRLAASLAAYDFEEFMENLDDNQWTVRGGFKLSEILYSENPVLLKIKFKDSLRYSTN